MLPDLGDTEIQLDPLVRAEQDPIAAASVVLPVACLLPLAG